MEKQKQRKQTIVGKNALVIAAAGEKKMAAQIFNYDHVKEIRLDLDTFEVKVLMDYDEAYYRVYSANPDKNNKEQVKHASETITKFYNDLVNASMKLTKEEADNIKKQRKEISEKIKAAATKRAATEKNVEDVTPIVEK